MHRQCTALDDGMCDTLLSEEKFVLMAFKNKINLSLTYQVKSLKKILIIQ